MTGASGHVGGAAAARLVEAGHDVVGLSRRSAGPPGMSRALPADITSGTDIDQVAAEQPCDAIVHAAAVIDPDPHAAEMALVNCLGTQRIVELAEHWSCAAFVFVSSVPVVGRPRELPVTEAHPVDPPTAYHASKLFGERLTELARRRGMAAASLRLTSPAGPGTPRGRILEVFVRRALAGQPLEVAGEGTRAQDYVDVRDVADAALACLEGRATGVFNIARGEAASNAALARRCVEVLDSHSEVRVGGRPDPDDGVRWEVSIERASETFGYSPSRTLEDSIAAVADGS